MELKDAKEDKEVGGGSVEGIRSMELKVELFREALCAWQT